MPKSKNRRGINLLQKDEIMNFSSKMLRRKLVLVSLLLPVLLAIFIYKKIKMK